MSELTWSWLSVPYFACAAVLLVVAAVGSIVQGDRVLRLGLVGAATTTLPWALCSGLVACTQDPDTATRLLRLGNGPVALVGPNLLLVVLGVSGQLERHRWVARSAAVVGVALLAVCWATPWTVPGVQRLSSGMLYLTPGPLTDFHISQLAIWLAIGLFIVRRSSTRGERQRLVRILFMVLGLGSIGAFDVLLLHGVLGAYPIAWLPATIAAGIAIYLLRYTNLLRQRGIDRGAVLEGVAFATAAVAIAALSFVLAGDRGTYVVAASVVWVGMLGASWTLASRRPVRIASERVLERFVAELADVDDHDAIVTQLGELWATIGVSIRSAWRADGEQLVELETGATAPLGAPLSAWLAEHGQALAPGDLATMRVGAIRPQLEALLAARGATLIVPLVDRDTLVALIEADHADALREDERGLVAESARAAARALTYAALAREAELEGENAREVEVAEAMRLQAAASRADELGRWSVAAEYVSAPRTTGAAWSATLLADGRLAVMVTEAQAHGVAAALATSALTGAFAAATATTRHLELDDLVLSLGASADGVMRAGEPIAAFLAVLDAERRIVRWASAGHPGAHVVGPVAYDLASYPQGSGTGPRPNATALGGGGAAVGASLVQATRGETPLPPDSLLVISSSAVRGDDELQWQTTLREHAPAGPRLASVLVDGALRRGAPEEDILAVVVRLRPDRYSGPTISPADSR